VRGLLALLPVALLLAACGGTNSAGGSALRTIQISEQEYSLNPSTVTVAKPGTYAFKVTNDGSITHAFTVEATGGGSEVEAGSISPGSSKTVKVTLDASKRYEMYCPVPGHKQRGMAGTINVGAAAGGGTTTNPEGETTTSGGMPGY
jgi:uncharacterized cupredoxin-like copper-binding protein